MNFEDTRKAIMEYQQQRDGNDDEETDDDNRHHGECQFQQTGATGTNSNLQTDHWRIVQMVATRDRR